MPICITGMHRSGTSMVARLLNICGLYLGKDHDLMEPSVDNPEGFWENLLFTKINDDLLDNYIGGGWDYFPQNLQSGWEKASALADITENASTLINEFSGFEPWGWKDPRNSLTFPFWRSICPDLKFLICIRNPFEVALSLKKRGHSSLNFGLQLWLAYNKNLIDNLNPEEYVVTRYDTFFSNPKLELERLLGLLGISASPNLIMSACSTISPSLQHNQMTLETIDKVASPYAEEVSEVYAQLSRLAGLNSTPLNGDSNLTSTSFFSYRTDQNLDVSKQKGSLINNPSEGLISNELRLSSEVSRLTHDLKLKDVKINYLNEVIHQIYNSTSWRITGPLRISSDTLRLIRRKLSNFIVREYRKIPITPRLRFLFEKNFVERFGFFLSNSSTFKSRRAIHAIVEKINGFDNINEADFSSQLQSAFPVSSPTDPIVTIIIPVFNQLNYTVRSLLSIAALRDKTSYEIIIIDDNSSDLTQLVIKSCQFIRYIHNEQTLGFLQSCNKAASTARGKYILLLNNDTFVFQNWLDSLVDTFTEFPQAGLVGSKLINPNLTLQEAGGVIWMNGDGWNYGRGGDPDKPQYNYLREVDYCSGASIIIPRVVWNIMEGFDVIYSPAYYEDTDLAFRIRQAGYKVLYQPKSQLIHFEGVSSGKDVTEGTKKYQVVNREKFVSRWRHILSEHEAGVDSKKDYFYTRYIKGRILFIDSVTPAPDQDSGSIDAYNFMRIFKKLGFEVSFLPSSNLAFIDEYTDDLQKKGIECQYYPYISSVDKYIREEDRKFDIVFLSRFNIAKEYIDIIRARMPDSKIIFNTVDLHFLREERLGILRGETGLRAQKIKEIEIGLMRKSDITILVSEKELELVNNLDGNIQAVVIPIPREIPGRGDGFKKRQSIVFIGGYSHRPNIDAVHYFVGEIWPLVSKQLPGVDFVIAGSNMPKEFDRYQGENIILRGFVENLGELFNSCRMTIAPLRYGAGVKGKIVTSLSYGVPCVATPVAIEGMGLEPDKHILCAATPQEFAESMIKLYSSSELWYRLSENGVDIVRQKYSLNVVEAKLSALMSNLLKN